VTLCHRNATALRPNQDQHLQILFVLNFFSIKVRNMNEIIVVIVFVGILLGFQLLSKTSKRPRAHYLKIFTAVALLILVWVFDQDGHFGPKVVLSALALAVIFKEYFLLRKSQLNS
jgi:hypothetical protein